MNYITAAQLEALAKPLSKNGYGQYLLRILRKADVTIENDTRNDRERSGTTERVRRLSAIPRVRCRGAEGRGQIRLRAPRD
jgi:hypothetical protein